MHEDIGFIAGIFFSAGLALSGVLFFSFFDIYTGYGFWIAVGFLIMFFGSLGSGFWKMKKIITSKPESI